MNRTILIVDDEDETREWLTRVLSEERYRVACARSFAEAATMLESTQMDLVLLTMNPADESGRTMVRRLNDDGTAPLVIVMTGRDDDDPASRAAMLGAYDYIRKPLDADAIKLIVRLAFEAQGLRRRVAVLKRDQAGVEGLIGESNAARDLRTQILQIAGHDDATILITGESGTGKELAANAIHRHSARRHGPFIDINCASVPPHLLESELFGFERGAFTDATGRKPGYFELADGGTLFLDEITELNTALQAKLLRVLEQRAVRHLGGTKDISVNVRVIAATNQDLQMLVDSHRFRDDLFYRLNVIPLRLVPLRERPGDIPLLLEHYRLSLNAHLSRNSKGIAPEAMAALTRYTWPGNVRELKNLLERILILYDPQVIELAHLPQEIVSGASSRTLPMHLLLPQEGISLTAYLASVEDQLIRLAMERTSNNISQAARLLDIPRETLRYKLGRTEPGKPQ